MRRLAYPYGRYLLKDATVSDMGPQLEAFLQELDFSIIKYDISNEGIGTVIIAVNKKIKALKKQDKPPGHLNLVLRGLLSAFTTDIPSLRDMDVESQRAGIEVYLWPVEEGALMELFVIPYMEHLNRPEIYHITESKEEEITDWFLCEQIWERVEPKIVEKFNAEPVHRRA